MKSKRAWLLCALLLWLCVAVVACGGGTTEVVRVDPTTARLPSTEPLPTLAPELPTVTLMPVATATAVLTPQETSVQPVATATEPVTAIPTPTDPPSDDEILDDLAEELFVSFGGAGGYCGEVPAGPLPAVTGNVFQSHGGWICLWGFSVGDSVSVELHDPSGWLGAAREFAVEDEEGVGLVEILVSFAGRPTGRWTISANSATASLETPFHVAEPGGPVISILPAGSDLFTSHGPMDWPQIPYAAGQQLAIYGAGFPPDRSLPLGIYLLRETDTDAIAGLLYGLVVQTDGQGRFEVYQPLEDLALLGEGTYFAIIQLDPSYQPMAFGFSPIGALGGLRILPPEPPPTEKPPPTAIPVPTPTLTPMPGPTPDCTFDAQGAFAALWQTYKDRLGCPLYPTPKVIQDAEQVFDNGHMFWRDDNRHIYVVYEQGALSGTYHVFLDEWEEGAPELSCAGTAPAERVQPKRGFGLVWCKLGGPAAAIGWALEEESGFWEGKGDPLVHDSGSGAIFRDSAGTVSGMAYAFFSSTGTFVHVAY